MRETIIEAILQELLLKSESVEKEEEEAGGRADSSLPLPMDHVFYKFNTSERRALYDYTVEVIRSTQKFLKF